MDSLGAVCVKLLEGLAKLKDGPLTIVETGTMFKTDLEPGETDLSARSTYAIAKWLRDTQRDNSYFVSIDADRYHIFKCLATLDDVDLGSWVTHREGRGYERLSELSDVDFCLLDADSNADSTLAEFLAVRPRLAGTAIVVVDDAFKHHSVNKALKILPLVQWYKVGGAIAIPFGPGATAVCLAVSRE